MRKIFFGFFAMRSINVILLSFKTCYLSEFLIMSRYVENFTIIFYDSHISLFICGLIALNLDRSKKARWSRLSRVRRAASAQIAGDKNSKHRQRILSPLVSEVATLYRALMTTAARRRRTPDAPRAASRRRETTWRYYFITFFS